jgi:Family of unknown function (DUF6152)
MRPNLAGVLVTGALVVASGAAMAHHSFAMFDQQNLIELEGVVKEFRYSAPHAFIILDVKQEDGTSEAWILEGVSPSALTRDGWSRETISPGDQIKIKVAPLRSGAPGGWWTIDKINFRDGRPVPGIP